MSDRAAVPFGWFDRVWDPLHPCTQKCCAQFVAKFKVSQLYGWKSPQRVLVGIRDLFAHDVPDIVIGDLYCVMARHAHLSFKVLTRDAYRMEQWFGCGVCLEAQAYLLSRGSEYPAPNIGLGIMAEDQMTLDERIGPLIGSTAASRFVLLHPIKEGVDLTQVECPAMTYSKEQVKSCTLCDAGAICKNGLYNALAEGIDEVILGNRTPDAVYPDAWLSDIVDQCQAYGVSVTLPASQS